MSGKPDLRDGVQPHCSLYKEGGQEESIKVGSPTETFRTSSAPGKSEPSGLIKQGHAVGWQHLYKKQRLLSHTCEEGQWH